MFRFIITSSILFALAIPCEAQGYLEVISQPVNNDEVLPDKFKVGFEYAIDSADFDSTAQYTINANLVGIYGTVYGIGTHLIPSEELGQIELPFKLLSDKTEIKKPYQLQFTLNTGHRQLVSTRYFIYNAAPDSSLNRIYNESESDTLIRSEENKIFTAYDPEFTEVTLTCEGCIGLDRVKSCYLVLPGDNDIIVFRLNGKRNNSYQEIISKTFFVRD